MINAGIIGLGKMGLSHCAILNAHPEVNLVGVCDTSKFNRFLLGKYSQLECFDDHNKMLKEKQLDCLFIGAGGTMTRELAVLGIPTISVYRSDILQVDSYLIKLGQMVHKPDLTPEFALEYMRAEGSRSKPRQELLDKGKQAYGLIKETILSMQDSQTL